MVVAKKISGHITLHLQKTKNRREGFDLFLLYSCCKCHKTAITKTFDPEYRPVRSVGLHTLQVQSLTLYPTNRKKCRLPGSQLSAVISVELVGLKVEFLQVERKLYGEK